MSERMEAVRPEDFYSDKPPGRIIGGEGEYDLQLPYDDINGNPLPVEAVRDRSLQAVIRRGAANLGTHKHVLVDYHASKHILQIWLDNGSKIYPDLGFLELSGAEVVGPQRAAAADAAGPRILNSVIEASGVSHEGVFRRSGSVKANPGYNGEPVQRPVTNGFHQNLLFPTSLHERAGHYLDGSLATVTAIGAYAWTGTLGPKGFEWSQKHRGIGKAVSHSLNDRACERSKPLVMFRNQHTNLDYDVNPDRRWSRAERRGIDPPHSRLPLFLSYAVPTLTLRLSEHLAISRPFLEKLILKDPVRAMHDLALSPDLSEPLHMADGRLLTADNIQEGYAEAYQHVAERIELPVDEQMAIPMLFEAAERQRGVRFGDTDAFGLVSDAAKKLCFLRDKFTKQPLDNSYAAAHWADLVFDRRINPGKALDKAGYGIALATHTTAYRELDELFVPQYMVDHFYAEPDHETRSADRADFVRSTPGTGYMDWAGYGASHVSRNNAWAQPYRNRTADTSLSA